MVLSLRRERDPERIKALLDLSRVTIGVAYISLLVLLTGGIVTGFLGHWWGQGWIWTALALLIALIVGMGLLGTGFYDRVRIAVGTQPVLGTRRKAWIQERPPPASAGDLDTPPLLEPTLPGGLDGRHRPQRDPLADGAEAVLVLRARRDEHVVRVPQGVGEPLPEL
jgi:hypothetical protein